MRALRRTLACLLFCAGIIGVTDARAETAEDRAAADALFDQGRALMKAGDLKAACAKLAESLRLSPAIGATLWLADCHEQQGRTATAWSEYHDAAALAAQKKDSREKVARKRMADLEPKLSKLVIVVPPASVVPHLEVHRGDVVVGQAAWGTELPVDPGQQVILAEAPGRKSWKQVIDIKAGTPPFTVTIPLLPADAAPPPPPPPPPVTEVMPPPEPDRSTGATQRTIGVIALGVGVVGVGLGTVFGLKASSAFDDSGPHCKGDICDPDGLASRSDAISAGNLSTIFFIAGGVLLAGGGVLFLTAPSSKSSVALAPWGVSGRW